MSSPASTPPGPSTEALRTAVAREGVRLVDAAELDLSAQVPRCDWTTTQLLDHLSGVLRFVTAVVQARGQAERPGPRPDEEDPVAFARAAHRDLLAALEGLDPDEPVWNWSVLPDTGAFWHRRMAHELLVHRLDAERAVADPTPVDADLAADGVAELLAVFLPRVHARAPFQRLQGSVRLEQTDGDGRWQVALTPDGARPDDGPADVTVRGRAEDLLLCAWGRQPWDVVDVAGRTDLLDAWTQEFRP